MSEDKIRAEHEVLRSLLDRICKATMIEDLLPLLRELRPHLAEHYEHEEASDGLHSFVTDTEPRLVSEVREVIGEHKVFLNDLDALIKIAQTCSDSKARVLSGISDLCSRLHDHESKEAELLGDAIYTELGEED